jgi:hypothetical protein
MKIDCKELSTRVKMKWRDWKLRTLNWYSKFHLRHQTGKGWVYKPPNYRPNWRPPSVEIKKIVEMSCHHRVNDILKGLLHKDRGALTMMKFWTPPVHLALLYGFSTWLKFRLSKYIKLSDWYLVLENGRWFSLRKKRQSLILPTLHLDTSRGKDVWTNELDSLMITQWFTTLLHE